MKPDRKLEFDVYTEIKNELPDDIFDVGERYTQLTIEVAGDDILTHFANQILANWHQQLTHSLDQALKDLAQCSH